MEIIKSHSLILKCYYNITEAKKILEETFPLEEIDVDYHQKLIKNLKAMIKKSTTDKFGTYVEVKYNRKDSGRYYIEKYGLQSINSKLRGRLVNGFVQDIDMVNCSPTILVHLAKKYNIDHKYLLDYVNNRDVRLHDLMNYLNIDKGDAKEK